MITATIIIVLVILGADAIYSRARRSLRQRTAAQSQRPAWDLTNQSGGGHPLREGQPSTDSPEPEEVDLSRLFSGRDSHNGRS